MLPKKNPNTPNSSIRFSTQLYSFLDSVSSSILYSLSIQFLIVIWGLGFVCTVVDKMSDERFTRFAFINNDRCRPLKCHQECKRICPVKLCVEVTSASKIAYISEELCIGCGTCVRVLLLLFIHFFFSSRCSLLLIINNGFVSVMMILLQRCPFGAIEIINTPNDLIKDITHRYGPNTFMLRRCVCCVCAVTYVFMFCFLIQSKNCNCRMPVLRPGQVLGLVGANGIGKSTALKVLAGKLKPNLGRFTV